MFKVRRKKNNKIYQVYDVVREESYILFLIYDDELKAFNYFLSSGFEPLKKGC